MELYLVRHGEAKRPEEDPAQPLSERGKKAISKVAGLIRDLHIRVRVIKHSGKLRAEETARELAKAVTSAGGIEQSEGLRPNDDVGPVKVQLEEAGENIMIVGHLPYLSRLASDLLCGDRRQDIVTFRAATVVRLDRDEASGAWHIRWVVTPDVAQAQKDYSSPPP
ncbi:MAG: phosphohistidine phosphatase SixA [Candidatus Brocadiales bacterium]